MIDCITMYDIFQNDVLSSVETFISINIRNDLTDRIQEASSFATLHFNLCYHLISTSILFINSVAKFTIQKSVAFCHNSITAMFD